MTMKNMLLALSAATAAIATAADFPVTGKDGKAIQAAIDAAAAAGGGRVVVKAGEYSSGTLTLKSNVELHLAKGALVIGTTNKEDYASVPFRAARIGGALIRAWNAENISITGEGVFDMRGELYFDKTRPWRGRLTRFYDPKQPRFIMVGFYRCKNIRFRDASFLNCPNWTMHIKYCEDIDFRRIKVKNHLKFINADGIDFNGCRRVYLADSDFLTGDDSVVMRAIRESGSKEKAVMEDALVENCRLKSGCQCIRVGCPSDDTIRNIRFRNITMAGWNGVVFDYPAVYLSQTDEGYMNIHDMTFENFTGELSSIALRIKCNPGVKIRGVRDVTFRNFDVKSPDPVSLIGNIYSPIERIRHENFTFNGEKLPDGEFIADCSDTNALRRTKPGEYNYKKPVGYVPQVYVTAESADPAAIQRAVDKVAENKTGGRVLVLSGTGGAGTVELRSNVEVRLAKGVTLGAKFVAKDAVNIAVTGPGTLDYLKGEGRAIDFSGCRTVRIDGIMVLCAPGGAPEVARCHDVEVDGVTVRDASGKTLAVTFPDCGRVRSANCGFPAVNKD